MIGVILSDILLTYTGKKLVKGQVVSLEPSNEMFFANGVLFEAKDVRIIEFTEGSIPEYANGGLVVFYLHHAGGVTFAGVDLCEQRIAELKCETDKIPDPEIWAYEFFRKTLRSLRKEIDNELGTHA